MTHPDDGAITEDALVGQITVMSGTPDLEDTLSRHRLLLHPGIVGKVVERAREKMWVNPRESLRIAGAALAVAESIADEESQAHALRAKANALRLLNDNKSAVELFDLAVSLFQKRGNHTEVGRTLSTSIQALIRLGEYGRAFDGAQRARDIFERSGDTLRLARLELNVANIHHRQDRFQQALDAYESAYRQLVPLRDAEAIGVALHNMAVCLISLNDFETALATHQNARAFCGEHNMPALVVQADYNISYLYYLRGEYDRSLEGLKAAAVAARAGGDAYHAALCSMDQAEIYLELNMSAEASEVAEEAYTQFLALGMNYEAAKSLTSMAIAKGQPGNTANSLELFSRARALFVEEGNLAWPSLIDLYQALVLFDAGRFAEALPLCAQALERFQVSRMANKEILCHLLLGRLHLRTGTPAEARLHCGHARTALETIEAPHLRYQADLLMGQVEEAAGDPTAAAEWYRAAGSQMERLREVLRDEELKIAFMKNKLEAYQSLIRLCLRQQPRICRAEEIFGYIEQAKSRTLRDLVVKPPDPRPDPGERPAAREIRNLREELNWYYHRLELEQVGPESASEDRVAQLQQEIGSREAKLLRMLRALPSAESGRAGVASSPPLSLQAIRAALGPGTVLVEYFRTGDHFLAAVLSATDLQIVELAPVSQVNLDVRLLQFQFSKFGLGSAYIGASAAASLAATNGHLSSLYQALVAPLRHLLHGTRLVLVPHENLHHVPLHALYDGAQYLVDSYIVSYAPSASVYALCQAQPVNTTGPALILAVADDLAPYLQNEAEAVAQVLPQAELATGSQATRQLLCDQGPASRLIHIGTHARFRSDNPMFSAIRLADGYLTLLDLYHLKFPAQLITLSGCSTGLSVVAKGDELLGLVRGFLNAGARTLLLSLWDVQDQTTAEMMRLFYTQLGLHADLGAALQGTMREVRRHLPHPYYWASFVLVGGGV